MTNSIPKTICLVLPYFNSKLGTYLELSKYELKCSLITDKNKYCSETFLNATKNSIKTNVFQLIKKQDRFQVSYTLLALI